MTRSTSCAKRAAVFYIDSARKDGPDTDFGAGPSFHLEPKSRQKRENMIVSKQRNGGHAQVPSPSRNLSISISLAHGQRLYIKI